MKKISFCIIVAAFAALLATPAFALVDINAASESELDTLPGIGPAYAKRIIDGRPYRSIDDITRVKGIGPKTFEKIKDMITVGGAPGKPKEAPPPPAPKAQPAPPPPEPQAKPEQKPIEVHVYSMDSKRMLKCWGCKNVFIVSGELKEGWCPYCMEKWTAK